MKSAKERAMRPFPLPMQVCGDPPMWLDLQDRKTLPDMKPGSRIVTFEAFYVFDKGQGAAASFLSKDRSERHTEYFSLKTEGQVARFKAFLYRLHKVMDVKTVPAYFEAPDGLVKWGTMLAGIAEQAAPIVLELEEEDYTTNENKPGKRVLIKKRFEAAMYASQVVVNPGRGNGERSH